jgi:uncharacterized membrane protein YqjE
MSAGLLESARNLVAGVLDLGRTRFELFSTELREELTRLTAAIVGGLAVLVFATMGLAFGAVAIILSVGEANRLSATIGVAIFFFLAAGVAALLLRRVAAMKARPFEDTLGELRRDLTALKS